MNQTFEPKEYFRIPDGTLAIDTMPIPDRPAILAKHIYEFMEANGKTQIQ